MLLDMDNKTMEVAHTARVACMVNLIMVLTCHNRQLMISTRLHHQLVFLPAFLKTLDLEVEPWVTMHVLDLHSQLAEPLVRINKALNSPQLDSEMFKTCLVDHRATHISLVDRVSNMAGNNKEEQHPANNMVQARMIP